MRLCDDIIVTSLHTRSLAFEIPLMSTTGCQQFYLDN